LELSIQLAGTRDELRNESAEVGCRNQDATAVAAPRDAAFGARDGTTRAPQQRIVGDGSGARHHC